MKRKFIINPKSGKGITTSKLNIIKNKVLAQIDNFDYVITKSKEDIIHQTQKALEEGNEQIIAVGGDGTIHQVVNGFFNSNKLINPEASLMVTNGGTGSDFYKTVSSSRNWYDLLTNSQIKEVDLGIINFDDNHHEYFINMASFGISATIVNKKEELPSWIPSGLSYIIPTLQSFTSLKNYNVKIITEEQEFSEEVLGIFVCKGMYAGGGMKFGSNSNINDGLFDITILKEMPRLDLVKNFSKIYNGIPKSNDQIIRVKTKSLSIQSQYKLPSEVDGESFNKNNIHIDCQNKALKVCYPRD